VIFQEAHSSEGRSRNIFEERAVNDRH
jgi:hypothetical protein